MKTKIFISVLLLAFLVSMPLQAQDRHERKLKREMAKLEKQMQKVQKLKGDNWFPYEKLERVKENELRRAFEIQKQSQEQALRQKELALQHAFRAKDQYRQYQDQARQKALAAKNWSRDFKKYSPEKNWERYGGSWTEARDANYKAIESQKRSMEKAKQYQKQAMEKAIIQQQEAMEKAKQYQKQAVEKAMIQQQEVIEKLKMELEKAKKELEEEKKQ